MANLGVIAKQWTNRHDCLLLRFLADIKINLKGAPSLLFHNVCSMDLVGIFCGELVICHLPADPTQGSR